MDNLSKSENLDLKDIKLTEGEKVLWSGRPEPSALNVVERMRIFFGIIWLTVAISVICSAFSIFSSHGGFGWGGAFFIPWALLIFSMGAYSFVGGFISEFQIKKNTRFVLTDKRAIEKCSWRKGWERSCNLTELQDIQKLSALSGKGSIVFADVPQYQLAQVQLNTVNRLKVTTVPVFYNIEDVDRVFSLAQSIVRGGHLETLSTDESSLSTEFKERSLPQAVNSGVFGDYLRPGEKLLWQGQPDTKISLLRKPDLMGLLGAGVSTSIISFLFCLTIKNILPLKSEYFLLIWLMAMLFMLLLAASQEKSLRKGMHYAVSDQRVLELMKIPLIYASLKYLDLARIHNLNKSLYNDGTGSLFFSAPGKGIFTALFGPEAIFFTKMNQLLRQEPVFLALEKPESVFRLIKEIRQKNGLDEISAQTGNRNFINTNGLGTKRIGKERSVSKALVAKLFLFGHVASSSWAVALILIGLACIAMNMFSSLNWMSMLESAGLAQSAIAQVVQVDHKNGDKDAYPCIVEYKTDNGMVHRSTSYYDGNIKEGEAVTITYLPLFSDSAKIKKYPNKSEAFFGGPFALIWAFGVLSICILALIFLFSQLLKAREALFLLKNGVRAQASRTQDDRVFLYVNRQPALCQRCYEFSVGKRIYQVKSITSVNQPRPKNVTVLFDPSNPDRSVVLDDLPGSPFISDDDMSIEFAKSA